MFHHSSFLAGGVTLAAGRLVVECGNLKVWGNKLTSYIHISDIQESMLKMYLFSLYQLIVDITGQQTRASASSSRSCRTVALNLRTLR